MQCRSHSRRRTSECLFVTACSMDEYGEEKRTEKNLIVRSGISEAETTNNKRLRSMFCIEAIQTRRIAWPLRDSRASCLIYWREWWGAAHTNFYGQHNLPHLLCALPHMGPNSTSAILGFSLCTCEGSKPGPGHPPQNSVATTCSRSNVWPSEWSDLAVLSLHHRPESKVPPNDQHNH